MYFSKEIVLILMLLPATYLNKIQRGACLQLCCITSSEQYVIIWKLRPVAVILKIKGFHISACCRQDSLAPRLFQYRVKLLQHM